MSDAWPPNRRPLATPTGGPAHSAAKPEPTGPGFAGEEAAGSQEQGAVPVPSAPPPGPGALPLPDVVETGNPAVDAALARLAAVGEVPAEARAGVYGEVHDLLRDTLAGLDERAGGAPTPSNAIR